MKQNRVFLRSLGGKCSFPFLIYSQSLLSLDSDGCLIMGNIGILIPRYVDGRAEGTTARFVIATVACIKLRDTRPKNIKVSSHGSIGILPVVEDTPFPFLRVQSSW